jgi:[acyl-carrier-protein] S-malonyltransferase
MAQRTALLFPGSGSQYVGMGKKLYSEYEIVRRIIEEANDTLGMDLGRLCFEGSVIKLNRTENILTSVLTVSVAMFNVYMQNFDTPPYCLAGHSLGEYSALCCSGAISFADALMIVKKRAELAEKARKQENGAMTVLKSISPETVKKICMEVANGDISISIACFNSPTQVIVSGSERLILTVEKEGLKRGAEIVPFIGSPPYHSPLMTGILGELEEELSKYTWKDMRYPIISNVTAQPYQAKDKIIEQLLLQMHKPVLWQQTMDYLQNQCGIDVIVEVGPQSVLKELAKENNSSFMAFSMDDAEDYKKLENILKITKGKATTDVCEHTSDKRLKAIKMCLGIAASTKNNNPDHSAHADFVYAYNVINDMKGSLDKRRADPSDEQVLEALEMLKIIFSSRQTPLHEQQSRCKYLLEKTNINRTDEAIYNFIKNSFYLG